MDQYLKQKRHDFYKNCTASQKYHAKHISKSCPLFGACWIKIPDVTINWINMQRKNEPCWICETVNFSNLVVLIHFLEAWSLLGAVHFGSQHSLEVWLIIGLCLAKIYSAPCIEPYTFWSIEIWLLYGPLQVPCLEVWLLIGTCQLIGTKE